MNYVEIVSEKLAEIAELENFKNHMGDKFSHVIQIKIDSMFEQIESIKNQARSFYGSLENLDGHIEAARKEMETWMAQASDTNDPGMLALIADGFIGRNKYYGNLLAAKTMFYL